MNLVSLVHARGWSALFNGFGGKDSAKSSPNDWIPFPIEGQESTPKDKRRISKETAQIFGLMLVRNQVPPHIRGAFMNLFDEIEELTNLTIP